MKNHSIDVVMGRLEHVLDDFDAIARHAHATFLSYPINIRVELKPRAAANCTYDHMVAEADRRFLDVRDIKPMDIRGLKLWLFGDDVVIRLKKMDEDGKVRNYPTKQARDFDLMRPLTGLPPAPARVSVGYVLDVTGQEIVRVQVARPNGKNVDWCAAIVPQDKRQQGGKVWEDVSKQTRAFA